MKSIYLIIMLCISLSSPQVKIRKIEIHKVSFNISTMISVTCDRFDNSFDGIKKFTIADKHSISKFAKYLKKMEHDPENYKPDVRAKVSIYYEDGKIETLCMSRLGILYNGQSYLMNKDFRDFIENK